MKISESIEIAAPASEIWKTLSSIDGVEKYLPIVQSSSVEGSGNGAQRTCSVSFGDQQAQIVEKIDQFNNDTMSMRISIVNAPTPLQGIQLSQKVTSLGEKNSKVEILSDLSEEQLPHVQGIMQMLISGLKKLHEEK